MLTRLLNSHDEVWHAEVAPVSEDILDQRYESGFYLSVLYAVLEGCNMVIMKYPCFPLLLTIIMAANVGS